MAVYDLTKEDLVLRTYFTDPVVSAKMMPLLDKSLYANQDNQAVVTVIRKFIKKFGRKPSSQELVTALENTGRAEEIRQRIMFICNTAMPEIKSDYAIHMVETFYQERSVELLLRQQAASLHDNNMEGIRDLIPTFKEKLNFSLHLNLGLDLIDDIDEAKRRLKASTDSIQSGIAEINMYTAQSKEGASSGGYPRKTLTLFVGQPNVGKSMILCSEAAHAFRNGKNVLYVSLELAEEYVWRRIASNLTGVEQYEVSDLSTEECQNLIYSSKNPDVDKLGVLKVKRLKTTATPYEIENLLDTFETSVGAPVDMLVIDYIGIMKPSRTGAVSEQSQYLDGQAKAEQIRELCIDRNMVGLSAIQFNRSGYSNLNAGLESVSGSAGYSETADLMITITKDTVLADLGMFANWIKKNRFGPNEVGFKTKTDFSTMRWYTASEDDLNAESTARAEFEAVQASLSTSYQGGGGGMNRPRQPKTLTAANLTITGKVQTPSAGTEPVTASSLM